MQDYYPILSLKNKIKNEGCCNFGCNNNNKVITIIFMFDIFHATNNRYNIYVLWFFFLNIL